MGASAQKQRRSAKSNGYWGGGGFTAIPDRLRKSEAFVSLSRRARALFLDIVCFQYNRKNNGDLCLSPKIMRPFGWTSHAGIEAARNELIERGFLVLSRQGGRNKPNLYALTCFAIDECIDKKTGRSKHDLEPSESPKNEFLLHGKN